MQHLRWLCLTLSIATMENPESTDSTASTATAAAANQEQVVEAALRAANYQPDQVVRNKCEGSQQYFAHFQSVAEAGMARLNLEGKAITVEITVISAKFVCPESLKTHILNTHHC